MKDSFFKIYDGAGTVGRVLIILFFIGIVVGLVLLIKKLFSQTEETAVDAAKDELKKLKDEGEVPSYSEAQFKSWADGIQQAAEGLGTFESEIGKYFKYMQNRADVLALIKAFGVREYKDDSVLWFNVKNLNLSQWLTIEMDPEELKEYVNGPLERKGIDYKF